MADHTIYLKVNPSKASELLLSNDGKKYTNGSSSEDKKFKTKAKDGDTVQWITADSSITSIDAITPDKANENLFNPVPTSPNWQGTVNSNKKSGAVESYSITYTAGGSSHTCDPKIQMV